MRLLLKVLLFTVLAPGTVAGLGPWLLTRGRPTGEGAWSVVAGALAAGGLALYAWSAWGFATRGHGTPAPMDPPRRLVVRGPYRVVRNPMYLGVLLVVLAWAVLLRSPRVLGWAAMVATAFHLFVVLYEEPHLRRAFGDEHVAHCRRVRRWLPRWPRADEEETC